MEARTRASVRDLRETFEGLFAEGSLLLYVFGDFEHDGVVFDRCHLFVDVGVALVRKADATDDLMLLVGIAVEVLVDGDDGVHPLSDDACDESGVDVFVTTDAVPTAHEVVRPFPLQVVVRAMERLEGGIDPREVGECAVLDAFDDLVYRSLGSDEPRDVEPFAGTPGVLGQEAGTEALFGSEVPVLHLLNDGIADELLDPEVVGLEAVLQGGRTYVYVVVNVRLAVVTDEGAELLEAVVASLHLADGEGAEEVEVDAVRAVLGMTAVTLWPLLRITYGTDGAQVGTGDEVGLVVVFDDIREGEVGGIDVVNVSTHDEAEGGDT